MIVRYRNRKFNNIEAADQWLTEYLLKRRTPITGCVLHSTRLTDLIYQSFLQDREALLSGKVRKSEPNWLMENGYENADITLITDGECRLQNTFTESFRDKMIANCATVTGILLDKGGHCGETLEPFCDKIYHSKELTEDEIAVQILNSKVA